jgi:Ca2+-binding EF-hand superfamily protein
MRQDGMVTKQDFVRLMEKRFDAMDKQKKGMLSTKDVAKVLDPNFAVN